MPYRDRLAREILHDYFGDVVESIGLQLIENGPQTLKQIIAYTKLDFISVRNGLITLIQHNLCKYITETQYYELLESKKIMQQATEDQTRTRKKKNDIQELKLSEKKKKQKEERKKQKSKMKQQQMDHQSDKTNNETLPNTNLTTNSENLDALQNEKDQEIRGLKITPSQGGEEEEDDDDDEIYYEIEVDQVIMRLRFAKFVLICKEKFGIEGEIIMETVLHFGRLTFLDLMNEATKSLIQRHENGEGDEIMKRQGDNDDDDDDDDDDDKSGDYPDGTNVMESNKKALENEKKTRIRKKLGDVFDDMVRSRYIKRVDVRTNGNEKSTKSLSKATTVAEMKRIAEEDLKRNGKKKNIPRKRKRGNEGEETEKDISAEPSKKKKKASNKTEGAQEMINICLDFDVEDDMESDVPNTDSADQEIETNDILWTINSDQFIREIRNNHIIHYILSKVGPLESSVMSSILSITTSYERSRCDETSTIVKTDDIVDQMKLEGDNSSRRTVEKSLNLLCGESVRALLQMNTEGSYVVQGIVENKYGMFGARIFRLLLEKKQLEQKQIAEIAMIQVNEARSVLYKMLQGGILQLQEVPRTNDHDPKRTFYLWNIHMPSVFERLTNDMYKTARNLRMRLVKEQRDAIKYIGGRIMTGMLAEDQKQYLSRLQKAEDRIENSLIKLAEMLLFFDESE